MSGSLKPNIYATECMGSSAHESIHPLEDQLALSYQILPANDEVCVEHDRLMKGAHHYASYQLSLTNHASSSSGGQGRSQAGNARSSPHNAGRYLANCLPCWTGKA